MYTNSTILKSLTVAVVIANYGCAGPQGIQNNHADTFNSKSEVSYSQYEDLSTRWNSRLDNLSKIHREGIVEFNMKEGQRHQTDMSLWIELPSKVALRAHKSVIGEEFIWLGCNEDEWWFFDLSNKEGNVLYQQNHLDEMNNGMFIDPLTILNLMGLVSLPSFESIVVTKMDNGSWRIKNEELEMVVNPTYAIPIEIRLNNFYANHGDYSRLNLPNLAVMEQPFFPGRTHIIDYEQSLKVLLSFDDPRREFNAESWNGLFDIDRLKRRYRPIQSEFARDK